MEDYITTLWPAPDRATPPGQATVLARKLRTLARELEINARGLDELIKLGTVAVSAYPPAVWRLLRAAARPEAVAGETARRAQARWQIIADMLG